ncbi:uncharacterized protein KY384_002779 [Bacidia gigantensis]|uniref:uncharacterized protein n=1 Tax=Bacidia gigantensis TaxID=2732470 RepID=UPI001D041C83|nr:uncharacterized protein KY384_002779 [Bacidia gigantensis]KAG8532901.1 hypothetical protein KY384_002779 [Bacidia gigantensis]
MYNVSLTWAQIISPAIDMIELISARGNTSLESAVSLTKTIRLEIQSLGQRLATAAGIEEQHHKRGSKLDDRARHERELKQIAQAIKKLLTRIEDAVPLINLAITASGANLSSSLPSTISPSRLLQASTFVTAGDSQYGSSRSKSVQVGPTFTLSVYMLFQGHFRPQTEEDVRQTTWKEVIHKADVRLMRVPIDALHQLPSSGDVQPDLDGEVTLDEYAYQIVIVEDLEDDRVHTFEEDDVQPEPYADIPLAGLREVMPIHEISRIFYADTGKILNIGSEGETNSPILLLKRDINAIPPRRRTDEYDDYGQMDGDLDTVPTRQGRRDARNEDFSHQALVVPENPIASMSPGADKRATLPRNKWQLPQDLDPEWVAFEVYTEADDSDTEIEAESEPLHRSSQKHLPANPSVTSRLSQLSMNSPSSQTTSALSTPKSQTQNHQPRLPPIRTSLSLLEMLLRLLSLQQFQQSPHLSIPDELLTFFLSEAASTGAASNDVQERRRLREEARRHVGFDPYDESPVKRRGEEYQYRGGEQNNWDDEGQSFSESGTSRPSRYDDEGYGTSEWREVTDRRQGSVSRSMTPQTPSLLKSRSYGGTPQTPSQYSRERPQPVKRYSERLRNVSSKISSPLSRSDAGNTDEGLGTSPNTPAVPPR